MWHKTDEDCHGIARAIADVMMTLDPQYFAIIQEKYHSSLSYPSSVLPQR
ncbi:hypothetical protein E2C01_100719 [Portunus trituberculatus]|uniref:Uncharacterized protein n=1 Tax=Portunus trituberculatus TaxID=210409 RepID=A0A5B7K3V2_PORTR|nr:hypothetical protein [Portunus trituberculatus]